MKTRAMAYVLSVIALSSGLLILALERPEETRAVSGDDSLQYIPVVKSELALEIEQVVENDTLPIIITDIVDVGEGRLYIASRDGQVLTNSPEGTLREEPVLDIRDRVYEDGNESGLVGLAVHPDFVSNRQIYVFYIEAVDDHYYSVVAAYTVGAGDNADKNSEQRILRFEVPTLRHHGGAMQFGPDDGLLYIGTGDGGVAYDKVGNAQSRQSLQGKILRIDVDGGAPYAIPADNPYVGDPTKLDEIWALGLRNPWRISFDPVTGDMFIGDVGENSWEEINFIPAGSEGGQNFGWSCREGPVEFLSELCNYREDYLEPIYTYPQDECAAVIGGFVYRGSQLPEITGQYFFSDLCDGVIWSLTQVEEGKWQAHSWGNLGQQYTTFGQRFDGEILLGALDHSIYQLLRRGTSSDE
ncbi:MAG: PQQ-dependent sugar dehydrogenase [Candidatus Promineifilaceae bacterium]